MRKRLFFVIPVIIALVLSIGCSNKTKETDELSIILPHEVVKPVVEAVLNKTETDEAKSVMGETANDTRIDFELTAVKYYKGQGEFTDEQAEEMVKALFEAIDEIITFSIKDTVYRDEKTAFVDVAISSIDQKDFEKKSREYLDSNAPEDYGLLSEADKAKYSYEAFIACCENIKVSNTPSKVTAKLIKYSTGWKFDNTIDFVLDLLTAYIGTAG